MNIYKLFFVTTTLFLSSCFASINAVKYCGKEYIEKPVKVYLVDENIETTMMNVVDKKTKKFLFGYHINAIRNDTNFIYSKIFVKGDTIINITYHLYKITSGIDSSISKYICTDEGLLFHTYEDYWNGKLKTTQKFDRIMGND